MTDTTPSTTEQSELKPCPLCGSTDLFLRDIAGWELDCRGCELSLVLADDPSREGLIARWNTRSRAAVATPVDAEELRRELAFYFGQYHGTLGHREDALRCMVNDCVRVRNLCLARIGERTTNA